MSVTQVRKDRERASREALILEHAARLLIRDGYQDLNLDELAQAVEYSKGTLYLHFESKEDLALAVATRVCQERADLFDRATRFTGRTRERMRAIGFACCHFAVHHRDYFNLEMMLKSDSFWEKASEERRRQHGLQAARLLHSTSAIVNDAIHAGDLPRTTRVQDVVFSLISITLGSHLAAMEPDIQLLCALNDPIEALRRNQDTVCDGWHWKPLFKDWDYKATDRRIHREIFPESAWFKPA